MEEESENCFLIKKKNGTLWKIYYSQNNCIEYEVYEDNKWINKNILAESARNNFFVLLSTSDYVYVFFQDVSGNVVLNLFNDNNWNKKVIFKSKVPNSHNIKLSAVFIKNDIHVFYTVKSISNSGEALVHQICYDEREWSSPKPIDMINTKTSASFIPIINSNNILLFYEKGGTTPEFGYRKFSVSSNIWSEFISFDKNILGFTDFSVNILKGQIHTLYIKESENISALIYNLKNNKTNKQIILSKGQQINKCILFTLDNHIWALWYAKEAIYGCYSTDEGEHFSNPEILYECKNLIIKKVPFQNNNLELSNHFSIDNLFIDNIDTASILVIPDLYPGILNICKQETQDTASDENAEMEMHLNYIKQHLNDAYEKIFQYQKQIKEKDHNIFQLNASIEQKNNDILNLQYSMKLMKEKLEVSLIQNQNLNKEMSLLNSKLSLRDSQISSSKKTLELQKKELEELKLRSIPAVKNSETKKENKVSFLKRVINFFSI